MDGNAEQYVSVFLFFSYINVSVYRILFSTFVKKYNSYI